MTTTLFDSLDLAGISLANRIVMAPLTRNRSPHATPQPITATYYAQRASAGLIITEATAISSQGQGYNVPGLYTQEALDGWRAVTEAVHAKGGKIVVQLWHVGRISHYSLQPDNQSPVAPSAIQAQSKVYLATANNGQGGFAPTSPPRALESSELLDIIENYCRAAQAALEVGFDGVEIHAANGYLLDQFLRSSANHRQDNYGGSIENRARFLLAVVQAITNEIGAERTGIRLSPVTPTNDVFDPEPQLLFEHVIRALAKFSLSYIHIIEGVTGGVRDYQQGSAAFNYTTLKQIYRTAGGKAAWMLNNGYNFTLAKQAVESGQADLISFGRLFISNPDLVERLRLGTLLTAPDTTTFYGGDEHGYTDYPFLNT